MMTAHDLELVESSRHLRWEDIDPDAAETEEGKETLRGMIARKYHREEHKNGIL